MNPKLVAKELLKRKKVTEIKFEIDKYLFKHQLDFVKDPSPFKEATTTRRAGKSVACVADLTNTCILFPNTISAYITLSRVNAKRLVWPIFKKLNREYKLGGLPNESELSIAYPNGSMLYLLGVKDKASIEHLRGLALKKVYLDECQSFPNYIAGLVNDVISPALMDHSGNLALIGTPGPIPSGYFYDITKNNNWSHHSWSYFDNPRLPFLAMGLSHLDVLNRELKRRGVGTEDPSIQREWFGKWAMDEESLVYKFNSSLNTFNTLPKGSYNYILGVDLGYDDADALAVLAWSEADSTTYLVDEVVTHHQGITELVRQINTLRKKWDITKIVVDTAGLGKKIGEEVSKRYGIAMEPAEKARKLEYIELMNDDLRTGRLKTLPNSVFSQDAMKVEWDMDKSRPDKLIISDRFHSDICEAVLYAWRYSYGFTHKPTQNTPKMYSDAWAKEEAERMWEAELEKAQEVDNKYGIWGPEGE
jgi:hypothetical protein